MCLVFYLQLCLSMRLQFFCLYGVCLCVWILSVCLGFVCVSGACICFWSFLSVSSLSLCLEFVFVSKVFCVSGACLCVWS